MGATTLSKLQMEQYQEIVKAYGIERMISMGDEDYARLKETLSILTALEYIRPIEIDGAHMFAKLGDFKDFDRWHADRVREEKKLSRREWCIATVSAAIGAFIGLLPTIVPWVISLFTMNE